LDPKSLTGFINDINGILGHRLGLTQYPNLRPNLEGSRGASE
jgi:hypothetical protein